MQVPTATSNNKGFTLIEVVVAILIMMVGLLGLLATAERTIETNTRNYMRDEAVRVGERYLSQTVNLGYDNVVPENRNFTVNLRSATVTYAATRTITQLPNSRQIDILLTWNYKNQNYNHFVSSIIGP